MTGERVLSLRELNRSFLERQLLLRRTTLPVSDAIEHLAGLQAQEPDDPYVGLWTRLNGFQPEALARMIEDRSTVRVVLMRATVHLVTARDCAGFRSVVQSVLDRALKSHMGRFLEGVDLDEVVAIGLKLVEEEPRTHAELRTTLSGRWPDRDPDALAHAVRYLLPLVQVPPRGVWGSRGAARHTTTDVWLGPAQADGFGPDELFLRYLTAYGPATPADARIWSGLTGVREVFERLRPQLRTFRDERGRELFDVPGGPLPDPDTPAEPRFLPAFDNAVLSHDDRTRIVSDEHRKRAGIVNNAVLVDGFVRGTWKLERDGDTTVLRVLPFAPLTGADRTALTEEGANLLSFATSGGEVRFGP